MNFLLSERWLAAYPGAAIGFLVLRHVSNPDQHELLDQRKEALEGELRAAYGRLDRPELQALPNIQPYQAYYKRFKKTYHVLQQLESVAQKGKAIPRTAALVEAMFMAELKNQLLTAGHDLEKVQGDVQVDVAGGEESYVGINGRDLTTKNGDMMIIDTQGILSSILYGPDYRTRINPQTRQVLFTVYAPPGIDKVEVANHLLDLQSNVQLVSPSAELLHREVLGSL